MAFLDNVFITGAYVGFIGFGEPFFDIGESISILQDTFSVNLTYNGNAIANNIYATSSSYGTYSSGLWIVETDKNWNADSFTNSGDIYLSNKRLSTSPPLGTVSNWVFNGAETFLDFNDWNYENYYVGSWINNFYDYCYHL